MITWGLLFICRLYYGMPELQWIGPGCCQRKAGPVAVDSYNLIFTYRDSTLVRIKRARFAI